jgi:hypothetical protein
MSMGVSMGVVTDGDLPGFVSGCSVSSGFVPEGRWEHPLLVASVQ